MIALIKKIKEINEKEQGKLTIEQIDELASEFNITQETIYDKTLVDLQKRDQAGQNTLMKYLNSMDEITISPEDDTSTFELISSWYDRHLYRIAQTLQQLSEQEAIFQKHVIGSIMHTSKVQQEIT